jgi:hypothetical protein
VSDAVRRLPFVVGLNEAMGSAIRFDLVGAAMTPGVIAADTNTEGGFSLRVYSPISTTQASVSVLNITSGTPFVWFASRQWLQRYLPDRQDAVEAYVDCVRRLGLDVTSSSSSRGGKLPLGTATSATEELGRVILHLARP